MVGKILKNPECWGLWPWFYWAARPRELWFLFFHLFEQISKNIKNGARKIMNMHGKWVLGHPWVDFRLPFCVIFRVCFFDAFLMAFFPVFGYIWESGGTSRWPSVTPPLLQSNFGASAFFDPLSGPPIPHPNPPNPTGFSSILDQFGIPKWLKIIIKSNPGHLET